MVHRIVVSEVYSYLQNARFNMFYVAAPKEERKAPVLSVG
jgi:hypothetical protein